MPVRRCQRELVADAEAVLGRPALVDDRAVGAEPAPARCRRPRPSRSDSMPALAAGSIALTVSLSPNASPRSWRIAGHVAGPRERALDRRLGRRPAVRAGDHVARADALLQRAAGRVLQARGDDRDERDQRDADRQRRRGRHRAAGLAHRVAPREPARRAADGLRRAPEQRRHARAPRATAAARRPAPGVGRPQRRDRRHAGRAPGGQQPGDERDQRADQQRDDDRARREHRARLGQREPHRVEQRVQRLRQPEPGGEADDRGEHADRERLGQHGAEHLAPVGADHPQQPELTRALGDGDRERVEDGERADEDRHAAEHQQRDPDDRDELLEPLEREAVLLGGGHDLGLAAARLPGRRAAAPPARRRGRRRGSRRPGRRDRTASARCAGRTRRTSRCRAT